MTKAMGHAVICSVITGRAGVGQEQASNAAKAVLQALAEQAEPVAFEKMLAELPPELAQAPDRGQHGERRSVQDFLARVAELDGTTSGDVRRRALAVFAALQLALRHDTLHGVLDPLGDEFTALLPPPSEYQDEGMFLETVRKRARLDTTEEATAVTRATLSVLAERVTAGQATDLAAYLPPRLAPLLHPEHEQARPFDYSEFLRGIAAQRDTAETQARAVLSTVREAVPETEVTNTREQLPDSLSQLFA